MSWRHESKRHSLASRGIKTKIDPKTPTPKTRLNEVYYMVTPRTKKTLGKKIESRTNGESSGILYYFNNMMESDEDLPEHFLKLGKKDDAYIEYVQVEPGYLNKGIGGKLLERAENEAKAEDKKRLLLICNEKNHKAYWMYRRRGYEPIAIDHKNKDRRFILMGKHLNDDKVN